MRPPQVLIAAAVCAAALGACGGASDPGPRRVVPISQQDELPDGPRAPDGSLADPRAAAIVVMPDGDVQRETRWKH